MVRFGCFFRNSVLWRPCFGSVGAPTGMGRNFSCRHPLAPGLRGIDAARRAASLFVVVFTPNHKRRLRRARSPLGRLAPPQSPFSFERSLPFRGPPGGRGSGGGRASLSARGKIFRRPRLGAWVPVATGPVGNLSWHLCRARLIQSCRQAFPGHRSVIAVAPCYRVRQR